MDILKNPLGIAVLVVGTAAIIILGVQAELSLWFNVCAGFVLSCTAAQAFKTPDYTPNKLTWIAVIRTGVVREIIAEAETRIAIDAKLYKYVRENQALDAEPLVIEVYERIDTAKYEYALHGCDTDLTRKVPQCNM